MAHVALVGPDNVVVTVNVINNWDLPNNGEFSVEAEEAAQKFQDDLGLTPPGHKWLLTSINNNFRGSYASMGDLYDEENDVFINMAEIPPIIIPPDPDNLDVEYPE